MSSSQSRETHGAPKAASGDSPVSNEMAKLLRELGIRKYKDGRDGLGFYALRHTSRPSAANRGTR